MNTDRHFEPTLCSTWDMGWFMKWYTDFNNNPVSLPTNEMILDVSLVGGFIDNIPDRRRMHTPFWHEDNDHMPSDEQGMLIDDWILKERDNNNWYKNDTEFNIPTIMDYHLGKRKYLLRPGLLQALKRNTVMPVMVTGEDWR